MLNNYNCVCSSFTFAAIDPNFCKHFYFVSVVVHFIATLNVFEHIIARYEHLNKWDYVIRSVGL